MVLDRVRVVIGLGSGPGITLPDPFGAGGAGLFAGTTASGIGCCIVTGLLAGVAPLAMQVSVYFPWAGRCAGVLHEIITRGGLSAGLRVGHGEQANEGGIAEHMLHERASFGSREDSISGRKACQRLCCPLIAPWTLSVGVPILLRSSFVPPMYALLRPLLFLLSPERAHGFTFRLLEAVRRVPVLLKLIGVRSLPPQAATEVMGLRFPSPVGLAAGMDKDAKYIGAMRAIGFGFVEVGTLTPLAQPGNDRPRLFRLKADRALINRMGFNNGGVRSAVERLRKREQGIIVGGNIGKNKNTLNTSAIDDYMACFTALYPVVDYFVVNVSSPNTPGLRALQEKEPLQALLSALRSRVPLPAATNDPPPKPILLKIAPDLTDGALDDIVSVVKESGIQGVVATNTTISREGLRTPRSEVDAMGAGGVSGAPVRQRSTEVVKYLRERLPKPFVIIGVGGIDSVGTAIEKLEAGADLVQLYTGLVYEGPALIARINNSFATWKSQR